MRAPMASEIVTRLRPCPLPGKSDTFPPDIAKSALRDLSFNKRSIHIGCGEDAAYVAKMLLAAALAQKFKFLDDHVFRRHQPNLHTLIFDSAPVLQCPRMQEIIGAEYTSAFQPVS